MASQNRNGTRQDQKSDGRRNVQQGVHNADDARAEESRGDRTADESEALTNALNPLKDYPKDQDAKAQNGPRNRVGKLEQPGSEPSNAQRGQAEKGGR